MCLLITWSLFLSECQLWCSNRTNHNNTYTVYWVLTVRQRPCVGTTTSSLYTHKEGRKALWGEGVCLPKCHSQMGGLGWAVGGTGWNAQQSGWWQQPSALFPLQPSSSSLVNKGGSPRHPASVQDTKWWRAMGNERREKGAEEHAWLRATGPTSNPRLHPARVGI